MVFRRMFSGSSEPDSSENLTIEDLIVLERYDQAEERLKAKLKADSANLHAHLKLAEVYTASQRYDQAVDEYLYVAGEYAQDGFYDKGLALLARAKKLRPLDDTLDRKIHAYEQAKRLEHSRVAAVEGLRAGAESDAQRVRAGMDLQKVWQNLVGSSLIWRLRDEQLRKFFAAIQVVRVEAAVVLAEYGSTLAQMALIGSGVVEAVFTDEGGEETVLRTFGSGDMIGEGALLEHRPWPATYRTSEPCTLLTLDRPGLEKALMGNPDPRGLLEALREQHNDRAVAAALRTLKESG